eukprot:m.311804 g.311804  ORF g.311804 m.311804 type:complete len:184 (+) comp153420_c0_seq1:50-601(+)
MKCTPVALFVAALTFATVGAQSGELESGSGGDNPQVQEDAQVRQIRDDEYEPRSERQPRGAYGRYRFGTRSLRNTTSLPACSTSRYQWENKHVAISYKRRLYDVQSDGYAVIKEGERDSKKMFQWFPGGDSCASLTEAREFVKRHNARYREREQYVLSRNCQTFAEEMEAFLLEHGPPCRKYK